MQMIIEATGYQKGGIYRHFASKKQLAQAVFQHNFGALRQAYLKDLEPDHTAPMQLLKLLSNFLETVANPVIEGGCPMLNMAPEVDDTDPEMRQMVSRALDELSQPIMGIVKKGMAEGTFRQGIDPQQEANFMMALIEGSIMMAKLQGRRRIILGNCERLFHYLNHFVFVTTVPKPNLWP